MNLSQIVKNVFARQRPQLLVKQYISTFGSESNSQGGNSNGVEGEIELEQEQQKSHFDKNQNSSSRNHSFKTSNHMNNNNSSSQHRFQKEKSHHNNSGNRAPHMSQQQEDRFKKFYSFEDMESSQNSHKFSQNNNQKKKSNQSPQHGHHYQNLSEKKEAEEKTYQFWKTVEAKKFDSIEFEQLKVYALQDIESATNFKHLLRYYRHLNSSQFRDAEFLNALARQSKALESSFLAQDVSGMCQTCIVFAQKVNLLTDENMEIARSLIQKTLRELSRLEQMNVSSFKHLNFGFTTLSKIPVEDFGLYDDLITRFLKTQSNLNDSQFTLLLHKTHSLILKLRSTPKYEFEGKVLTKRIDDLMKKQQIIDRVLKITQVAITDVASLTKKDSNEDPNVVVCKLAQALSKQLTVFAPKVLEDKNLAKQESTQEEMQKQSSEQAKQEEIEQSEYAESLKEQDIVYLEGKIYGEAWKNIEIFINKNHQKFDESTFKFFLQAVVTSRVHSETLYSNLISDFCQRITSKQLKDIDYDFYCSSLNYFFRSHIPAHIMAKYEDLLFDFSRQIFGYLLNEQKLLLIIIFSTIGNKQTVNSLLQDNPNVLTPKVVSILSLRSKIELCWKLLSIGVFQQDVFNHFVMKECDPSNAYFGKNLPQLHQVTQILMYLKMSQPAFWKLNEVEFNEKLESFTNLTKIDFELKEYKTNNHKRKDIGSFEIADVLSAFQLKFFIGPIIEDIFRTSYQIKGISFSKLRDWHMSKKGIANQFDELRYKEYSENYLFKTGQQKCKIEKKSDLFIEIDQRLHYFSSKEQQQIPNLKVEILRKMGYHVVRMNYLEIDRLAKLSKGQILNYFLDLFENNAPKAKQTLKQQQKIKSQTAGDQKEEEEKETI